MMILAVSLLTLVVIANTDGFLTTKGFYPWTSGYPVYTSTKQSYTDKYVYGSTTSKYSKFRIRNPFKTNGKAKRSLGWTGGESYHPWMGGGGFPVTERTTKYRPWMGGGGGHETFPTSGMSTTTRKYRPWMGGGGGHETYPTSKVSTTTSKYRPWMGGGGGHETFPTSRISTTTMKYRPWMGGGGHETFPTSKISTTTRKYRPWMGDVGGRMI